MVWDVRYDRPLSGSDVGCDFFRLRGKNGIRGGAGIQRARGDFVAIRVQYLVRTIGQGWIALDGLAQIEALAIGLGGEIGNGLQLRATIARTFFRVAGRFLGMGDCYDWTW